MRNIFSRFKPRLKDKLTLLYKTMRLKYNKDLLLQVIARDKCHITEEILDSDLGVDKNIEFTCSCGNPELCTKNFRGIVRDGGGAFCPTCTLSNRLKKSKASNLKIYGTEYASQSQVVKNKIVKTSMEKWGVPSSFQSKVIREKIIETNLQRYGVENVSQCQFVQDKVRETNDVRYGGHPMQNEDIKLRWEAAIISAYGCKTPLQNAEVQEKIKETVLSRYGCENVSQNEEIKEKKAATCLEHYGVSHPMFSEEVKQTMRDTCMDRYGVEYAMQDPEIAERAGKNAYKYKKYIMPDGDIRIVQGYEPLALDILTKEYTPEYILTSRVDVPEVWWYDEDNHAHRYFVDIYLPSTNTMVEVKSTWTFAKKYSKTLAKQVASSRAGYNHEIWVFDDKHLLVEKIILASTKH